MENLAIRHYEILFRDQPIKFEMQERDHGELIVYDVTIDEAYQFTISKEGNLLFNNEQEPRHPEAADGDKQRFLADHIRRTILPEL